MEFHEKLQELRKRKGLTQEELAEQLFVSRTAVSKWESGRGYPSIDSLKAISRVLGVSLDDLLSGDTLLTIAEEENKQHKAHTLDLLFGLLDCSAAAFFFLPLFAQRGQDLIREVSLVFLTGWVKIPFLILIILITVWGIGLLSLQNTAASFWIRFRLRFSLALSITTVLLFTLCQQPYAAVFAFILLAVKTGMLFKMK